MLYDGAVQPPTLRDVAEAAGVHAATVSRALNPQTQGMVNAATARRIAAVAERLGYRANPIARGLKTSKSSTVGVVIPDLTNPIFPPTVRGIEDVLGPAGFSALIVNTDSDLERERWLVSSLRSRQVEGLIVATAMLDHALLNELKDQGVNLVLMNRRTDNLDVSSISPDDAGGIELAVRHLVELGHRSILHLAGPQTDSTGLVRCRAFLSAMRAAGIPDDHSIVASCEQWSEEAGAKALSKVLDSGREFTAIVAGNDLIALGCYDAFKQYDISCPEDVSVVGFNGMPFVDKLLPPLTTVLVPHHEVGVEAARMLLDLIKEPDRRSRSVFLPTSLVVRGSTATPH